MLKRLKNSRRSYALQLDCIVGLVHCFSSKKREERQDHRGSFSVLFQTGRARRLVVVHSYYYLYRDIPTVDPDHMLRIYMWYTIQL